MDFITLLYTILKICFYPGKFGWPFIAASILLIALEFHGIYLILKKTDINPKRAYIPFDNIAALYELSWKKRYVIPYFISASLWAVFSFYPGMLFDRPSRAIAAILSMIAAFVIHAFMKLKLSRSFVLSGSLTYCLLFMEAVFLFVLGKSSNTYLGPCVSKKKLKLRKRRKAAAQPKRTYMIALYKKRSVQALSAAVLVLFFNFQAISSGLIEEYLIKANDETYAFLHFFTVNSAILSSLGAAFMIPYAVEGIRKKRFAFPKWVSLFQFSGAFCTSLTMFFAFTFIYLTQGPKVAFGGPNFWMHVVCPIFSLVLFLSVETDRTLSVRDSLICMTPFFIYSVFYVFNAVLIGEELGGWRDFYMFATYTPATYSLPMIYVFAFIVITIIRLIYNSLSAHRTSLFISSMGADISEIEINIEIYGLGRYNGKHLDFSDMTIPYDIFRMLEKQYGVSTEKLSVIYSKGINDGIKERKERKSRVLSVISSLIGEPEKS